MSGRDAESPRSSPDSAIEPVVNAVWIGASLGDLHAACLRSFVMAGHRMRLHCYDVPSNVPAGVETFDASRLMSRDQIVYYKSNGSPSLFSNLYRLKILEAGLGLYVDCDVFCLRPIPRRDYIFGYQASDQLNGAVLKLPAGSQTLLEMLKFAEDPYYIAPWLRRSKLARYKVRRFIGLPIHISNYGWGKLGPEALTFFARQAGTTHHAAPIDVFYPIHYQQVAMLLDPELSLSHIGTPRTLCIHLFDQTLRQQMAGHAIAPGSPLGQMLRSCGPSRPA